MIKVELSETDWLTSKSYWNELTKCFVNRTDRKKADFISNVLFESRHASNMIDSQPAEISSVSVNTMSELMNEIDEELKTNDSSISNVSNHTKNDGIDLDENIKKLIHEPVLLIIQYNIKNKKKKEIQHRL